KSAGIKRQIAVPDAPGLGVELDWEQVRKAHDAYKSCQAARVMMQARCNT
ncbi:glucarate dehydratase, partial [Salmonella enterica subsp. enterica serovar Heidelberg str. 579083-19]